MKLVKSTFAMATVVAALAFTGWATIGNVAIVIDEDQLSQTGIDFIASIPSDIAPNIAFKPEYVKPDAKILQIEAQ